MSEALSEAFPEAMYERLASYPFHMTLQPRHDDLDASGFLGWRALAEYHEESRTRFMVHLFGANFLDGTRAYRMLPVKVRYDYLRPAGYPHPLTAGVGVVRIGTASFEIAMALFQDGACISLSRAVTVHVAHGGACPLPAALSTCLQQGLLRPDAVVA
ncbi:MAG: acyl-CoA thioesterase [Sterolibacterium sp.]|nr:acyl-CoA thioesterase [Sterolibacterium sp.]MBP9799200.1 acyl-CoA thioesterase [Sterolibacterium sp.]